MAYEHRPLTPEEIGPAASRVIGPEAPGPLRTMAARGLAPLPPRDVVVALYQLWVSNDPPELAAEAGKTVEGLPDAILGGALDDARLPAGVLDFLGRKLARNEAVLERVVRHPRIHDETLAGIARLCPEGICDLIAENQQRWLAFPAIVEALYQNPNCRMSVTHRMLELAVRQGVDVKLPNMEEIKAALGDGAPPDPARDGVFRGAVGREATAAQDRMVDRVAQATAGDDLDYESTAVEAEAGDDLDIASLLDQPAPDDLSLPVGDEEKAAAEETPADEAPEEKVVTGDRTTFISKLKMMEKLRLALLGNAFDRSVLIRDSNKVVALSAIKSPKVRENEVVAYSAARTLHHEVIRYIATKRRDWTKLYAVKLNLVLNPKTPMSTAMTFLGHLHQHDVRKVAHSRNIPSALTVAAKRKMNQRR